MKPWENDAGIWKRLCSQLLHRVCQGDRSQRVHGRRVEDLSIRIRRTKRRSEVTADIPRRRRLWCERSGRAVFWRRTRRAERNVFVGDRDGCPPRGRIEGELRSRCGGARGWLDGARNCSRHGLCGRSLCCALGEWTSVVGCLAAARKGGKAKRAMGELLRARVVGRQCRGQARCLECASASARTMSISALV